MTRQLATNTSASNTNQSIAAKEKLSQFLWTSFILLFFVIQAILWTVAIMFTSNDKSHAVVAGYDEQALKWDELVAERNASERLSWSKKLTVDPAGDVLNIHTIVIELTDREGHPVKGASILLRAFHRALAGDPQTIEFQETDNGVYSGKIRIQKSGYWQFEGRATKEGAVFLLEDQQFLKVSQ